MTKKTNIRFISVLLSVVLAVSFMCIPAEAATSVSFAEYTTNTRNTTFKVMASLQGSVVYNTSAKAIFNTVYAAIRYDSYEGKTSYAAYSDELWMSIIVIGEYASGEYMPEIKVAETLVADGDYIGTTLNKNISSYNVVVLTAQFTARVPNTLTYYNPDNISLLSSTVMANR
ncbi:MAG: hypothetical protein LUI01_06055 [Firmicutes bacterium]|nr:hypothetical protein [Bacillota bacterium]